MPVVKITEPAERSLNHIFNYYFQEVSLDLAVRMTDFILDRIETLASLHERGRTVEELKSLNQNHRYIIEGSFKIIYKEVDQEVYVTDIFGMYLDPKKMKQRN